MIDYFYRNPGIKNTLVALYNANATGLRKTQLYTYPPLLHDLTMLPPNGLSIYCQSIYWPVVDATLCQNLRGAILAF
jgi:hypothetical protein